MKIPNKLNDKQINEIKIIFIYIAERKRGKKTHDEENV